ncbi:MAG: response regulator [Planctomycetota bacterium]|jgi:CheY-like chemotaxis protein
MRPETIVLIVEDSDSDYSLIRRSLELAGLHNPIKRFKSRQQALDFLSLNGRQAPLLPNQAYVLFLDVGDCSAGGLPVLEQLKQDTRLKKIPVIILTDADDPETVEHSHQFGCSVYIVKPRDESALGDAIRTVGSFLSVVEVPQIGTKP